MQIDGALGTCGALEVFLGFAPASVLYRHSFADVLNDDSRAGYQRRFSEAHSLEFRRYIQSPGSTTIPLTFNLRPPADGRWELRRGQGRAASLIIHHDNDLVLSQVDCQHRLGFLSDQEIELAFMAFIGLDARAEMEVFSRINSKAKGLNPSLLDFNQSRISTELAKANPALYVALQLNEHPSSPWKDMLDLGGDRTVGMMRRASLRTMQNAVRRFIRESALDGVDAVALASIAIAFWSAVARVANTQWKQPRRHLITKGIGVYSLMSICGDLSREATQRSLHINEDYFVGALFDFLNEVDWSNDGPMKGLGGGGGADQATRMIRGTRRTKTLKVVARGK